MGEQNLTVSPTESKKILSNGKFWHWQPLSETVNLLKAGQPTESSSSKTEQVGGNIPGPGSCSSPACGKLKEPRRTKPATSCTYRYLPSPRPSLQTCYIFSLPLEHSELDTPIALCSWSAARLLQRSLCDVQLGTALCDLQTGPQSPEGAGAHLHSLPVFGQSHCTYSPRAAECPHKAHRFHTPHVNFAQRRETKVCSTNSHCHEHKWPQNSEDFAKSPPNHLSTVWQAGCLAPTSTECHGQRTLGKHARHMKSTIWTHLRLIQTNHSPTYSAVPGWLVPTSETTFYHFKTNYSDEMISDWRTRL